MIKDCIFSSDNIPEELKEIIRDSSIVFTGGVSCNYVNGKYINIRGIYDFNTQALNENHSLIGIISRIKPVNLFEIALCLKLYNDLLFHTLGHKLTIKEEKDLHDVFFKKLKRINKYKIIRPLLMDSRGWLVWRYQLFNILSLAVDSHEKINFCINGLNAKKSKSIDKLKHIKINELNVYDIITQLSLPTSSMTYGYPNLQDSLVLNNELKLF